MRIQRTPFIAIIVVGIALIGLLSLVFRAALFPDTTAACSKVAPSTTVANNKHSAIQILSPANDDHVVNLHELSISIKLQNFDLNQDGNKLVAWVDGIPVDAHTSEDSVVIDPGTSRKAHYSLSEGSHSICLALIDGQSGKEVGDRAGVRISWAWPPPPDKPDFTWIGNLCFLTIAVTVAMAVIISSRGPKQPTKT